MGGDAARAGDDDMSREKTAPPPPLSAGQINQLLYDVAREAYARADALTKLFDELEGDFEARAAAGGDASDLRARLAELSRMEEELSVEFEARLRDLDVMVRRRLAALRAGDEDDAAATMASGGVEDSSAAAADLFEDGND